jgi:acyl-CoA reductase-like NAD-dependent aldehyde dehydrogenase
VTSIRAGGNINPSAGPASSAAIVALPLAAGAPAEAAQPPHGGDEIGAALCAAPEVAVASFTGSPATGSRRGEDGAGVDSPFAF